MDLKDKLKTKAEKFEVNKIRIDLERFALYEDYKELHAKVLPPIDMFQKQMIEFQKEHV